MRYYKNLFWLEPLRYVLVVHQIQLLNVVFEADDETSYKTEANSLRRKSSTFCFALCFYFLFCLSNQLSPALAGHYYTILIASEQYLKTI